MLDIESIAQKGNDLETLKALRQKIAHTIDHTESARDIPSLSRQLQAVMSQITELEKTDRNKRPTDGDETETLTALEIVRKRKAKEREKTAKK